MPYAIDPLQVSPYLTLPCRDLRCACMALWKHSRQLPHCAECPLRDKCRTQARAEAAEESPALLCVSWPTARVPSTRSSIEWRFVTGGDQRQLSIVDVHRTLYRRTSSAPRFADRIARHTNGSEATAETRVEAAA